MKLIGFTCTYNEAEMVPYVMPYVERMGYDKFIVYDNESTDNTVELLKQYPFVEVRTYKTNGEFNNTERIKMAYTVYGEAYKMANVGKNNEELVWLTITDFDEVLFFATKTATSIKDFLYYRYYTFGENYFNNTMLNLFPKNGSFIHPSYSKEYNFVHLDPNIMASYWTIYGDKTTIFAVNDFYYYETCKGFHWTVFKMRKNRTLKTLSDSGEVFGFHLKFINKDILYKKHESYKERQSGYKASLDNIYDSLYTTQFKLENYFLQIPFMFNLNKSKDCGIRIIE
jgi:hypothetical protein